MATEKIALAWNTEEAQAGRGIVLSRRVTIGSFVVCGAALAYTLFYTLLTYLDLCYSLNGIDAVQKLG